MSTSLGYPPARYAQMAELSALASIAARHGGIYATHMRSYGKKDVESLEEVFTIARTAHLPVEIWHLGLTDEGVWGRAGDFLAAIERARSEGLDITADAYPYDAGQNALDSQLPDWAHEGGVDQMIARFHDPAMRSRIIHDWIAGDPPDVLTNMRTRRWWRHARIRRCSDTWGCGSTRSHGRWENRPATHCSTSSSRTRQHHSGHLREA